MNIKKEYKEIIIKNEQLRDAISLLKENDMKYNNINYLKLEEEEVKKLIKEEKENDKKIKLLKLEQSVLMNNLLFIQRKLLKKALEIYQQNYKNKNLGEKTKEKFKKEVEEYIKDSFDIEIYVYIKIESDFIYNQIVKISMFYKDFYYIPSSKEELHYNKNTNDEYYYYYSDNVKYIKLDKISEHANKIYNNYYESIQKIKVLNDKINEIRAKNNENCYGALNDYYIKVN